MYEKPEVLVVMTDEEDIIRTSSSETLENIGAGGGTGSGDEIEWGKDF